MIRVGHSTIPERVDEVHACVTVRVVPGRTVIDVAKDATVSVKVMYFVAVASAVVPLIDSDIAVTVIYFVAVVSAVVSLIDSEIAVTVSKTV